MMFRTREAARVYRIRHSLFSPEACHSLERDQHHFDTGFEDENIFSGFRKDALEFFTARKIKWHDGGSCDTSIVSSQIACLNSFFSFVSDPLVLKEWLSRLYPNLDEVLAISSKREPLLVSGQSPFLTFEWIGERNYLGERSWGVRGQNCTSADVLFRFRTTEGNVHLVLCEWKYCERYEDRKQYIHFSPKGTDRTAIYRPHFESEGCQLQLGDVNFHDLFFEPFDQIMRLQLLASAMERNREMEADIVSVLHIAPRANDGMLNSVLADKVGSGSTIGEVWRKVVVPGRFKALATEDLIPLLLEGGYDTAWSEYIKLRYGAMD